MTVHPQSNVEHAYDFRKDYDVLLCELLLINCIVSVSCLLGLLLLCLCLVLLFL